MEPIPLFRIDNDESDVKHIQKVIQRGSRWAQGPEIEEFEQLISEYIGTEYCVVYNSGTSALHACLHALKIGKGDNVLVPSFTFIATSNAPLFVGATPNFVDIEDRTFGLDPVDLNAKIDQKTKAIIPIHYGGHVCMINELKEIANDRGIFLIEDAAESMGATLGHQKTGTFGDAAILSFCQNKIITTGEGGAVVTSDKSLYDQLKLFRSHGRLETADYFSSSDYMDYIALGHNYRISSLSASLGLSQLSRIDTIIQMRRNNAHYLDEKLSKIPELKLIHPLEDSASVYQLYTIQIPSGSTVRDNLKRYLNEHKIMSKIYFDPVHLYSFYRAHFNCHEGQLPMTERISKEVLTLPMFPTLSVGEMDYICSTINEFFDEEGSA